MHELNTVSLGFYVGRFSCNFGPADHSHIYVKDLKGLLMAEQLKRQKRIATVLQKKRRGKKPQADYDKMSTERKTGQQKQRMSQKEAGTSMKKGCQRHFLAKQNYMDNSLCQLVYKISEHVNSNGDQCHGLAIPGCKHSMGTSLSDSKKKELTAMLDCGLTPTQVMIQHKAHVMELALANAPVGRDTFVLPHDVRNLANKRAGDLWMKHKNEIVSLRMWKDENIKRVFFYQEHSLMDMNQTEQQNNPFGLGFQTEWQFQMMLKFGHGGALAIDATFGTSHSRVSYLCNFEYASINVANSFPRFRAASMSYRIPVHVLQYSKFVLLRHGGIPSL